MIYMEKSKKSAIKKYITYFLIKNKEDYFVLYLCYFFLFILIYIIKLRI